MENAVPTWANQAWAWLKQIDEAMHYDPIYDVRARWSALEQIMESREHGAIDDGTPK